MNLPQGLLGTAGLMGLCVGLLLASVPAALAFAAFRRLQEGLRRRHAELAATYRRNQSIVEGSGEGVLELDRAGYVRYANPAAVKLLAYEAHELIGLDYRVLLNTQEDGRTDAIRQIG
ncbi:MAG: PAS domain-containing protein, partial [Lysobacterales bacterium]